MSDASNPKPPKKPSPLKAFLGRMKAIVPKRKRAPVEPATSSASVPMQVAPVAPQPSLPPWDELEKSVAHLRSLTETTQSRLGDLDGKLAAILRGQVAWEDFQYQLSELSRLMVLHQEAFKTHLKSNTESIEKLQNEVAQSKISGIRFAIGAGVGLLTLLGLLGFILSSIDRLRTNSRDDSAKLETLIADGMSKVESGLGSASSEVSLQSQTLQNNLQSLEMQVSSIVEKQSQQAQSQETRTSELRAAIEEIAKLAHSQESSSKKESEDLQRFLKDFYLEQQAHAEMAQKDLAQKATDKLDEMIQRTQDSIQSLKPKTVESPMTTWNFARNVQIDQLPVADPSLLPVPMPANIVAREIVLEKLETSLDLSQLANIEVDPTTGLGILRGIVSGQTHYWLTHPSDREINGSPISLSLTFEFP